MSEMTEAQVAEYSALLQKYGIKPQFSVVDPTGQGLLDMLQALSNYGKLPEKTETFFQSIKTQWNKKGKLSGAQWYWAAVRLDAVLSPKPEKSAQTQMQVGSLQGVVELFKKAKAHLNKPAIVLSWETPGYAGGEGPTQIKLYPAPTWGKNPGLIYIRADTKGDEYFGKVTPEGAFVPTYMLKGTELAWALADMLGQLSADPAGVAAKHGKLTGKCCFCNSGLTDPKSTEVGYGPVCAKHFGLPWGTLAAGKKHDLLHADFNEVEAEVVAQGLEDQDDTELVKNLKNYLAKHQKKHPTAVLKLFPSTAPRKFAEPVSYEYEGVLWQLLDTWNAGFGCSDDKRWAVAVAIQNSNQPQVVTFPDKDNLTLKVVSLQPLGFLWNQIKNAYTLNAFINQKSPPPEAELLVVDMQDEGTSWFGYQTVPKGWEGAVGKIVGTTQVFWVGGKAYQAVTWGISGVPKGQQWVLVMPVGQKVPSLVAEVFKKYAHVPGMAVDLMPYDAAEFGYNSGSPVQHGGFQVLVQTHWGKAKHGAPEGMCWAIFRTEGLATPPEPVPEPLPPRQRKTVHLDGPEVKVGHTLSLLMKESA